MTLPNHGAPRNAKKRRGEAALLGADPWTWLLNRFINAKAPHVKERLALELLPYVKPKLTAVKVEADITHDITITIGGASPVDMIEGELAPLVQLEVVR